MAVFQKNMPFIFVIPLFLMFQNIGLQPGILQLAVANAEDLACMWMQILKKKQCRTISRMYKS